MFTDIQLFPYFPHKEHRSATILLQCDDNMNLVLFTILSISILLMYYQRGSKDHVGFLIV